jgi:acetyl esterase
MMLTADADTRKLLDLAKAAGRPSFERLSPTEARAAYAASWDFLQRPAEDVQSTLDARIATKAHGVPARIYRGVGTSPTERLPALVFLHGGGWVIGNLESHDRFCRRLANLAGIAVVAVDYRLAPEHPYPAALEDAVSAFEWTMRNAEELCIDVDRVAVGGDSAGGNLAAVLALMGRDGAIAAARLQVLLYPVTDVAASSDSYRRFAAGVPLTAATMHYFIGHYAPDVALRADWHLSPIRAASLADAPPALVLTVGLDPLCDEGQAYARRLEQDGVRVTSIHAGGLLHGALMQERQVGAARRLVDFVGLSLGDALRA